MNHDEYYIHACYLLAIVLIFLWILTSNRHGRKSIVKRMRRAGYNDQMINQVLEALDMTHVDRGNRNDRPDTPDTRNKKRGEDRNKIQHPRI